MSANQKLPVLELGQQQHNEATMAVWNVLAREIGDEAANRAMSGMCVDAAIEALNRITRRPNPAHGAPKPPGHNPVA